MCLAVPGRVVAIEGDGELRMARIDFDGVMRDVCLAYVPEARLGDYVLVHVGFAIATIDESEARETLAAIAALELPEEPG